MFVLFIVLPIAAVVLVSFSSASFIVFPMAGFSFRWYRHIVEYRPFIDSLIVSVELAFASAICSAALGVPAALALARSRNPAAGALVNLLVAPVSVPAIVLGFALLYFLAGLGLGLSFISLLIAHSVAGMPYVVRTVLATYRGVAPALEEAASILGADRWQVLRHVTLPMVRPGIFAGATFAVLTSLDNLPLSYFFGSASTNTLPGGDAELHGKPVRPVDRRDQRGAVADRVALPGAAGPDLRGGAVDRRLVAGTAQPACHLPPGT